MLLVWVLNGELGHRRAWCKELDFDSITWRKENPRFSAIRLMMLRSLVKKGNLQNKTPAEVRSILGKEQGCGYRPGGEIIELSYEVDWFDGSGDLVILFKNNRYTRCYYSQGPQWSHSD